MLFYILYICYVSLNYSWMRNVSYKICREYQNTHFMFNIFFFRKSCRLWDNVEKCCTAWQATCALQAGYLRLQTHTLRLCNTYCFSRPRLHERASMLRYTYTVRLIYINKLDRCSELSQDIYKYIEDNVWFCIQTSVRVLKSWLYYPYLVMTQCEVCYRSEDILLNLCLPENGSKRTETCERYEGMCDTKEVYLVCF
jgi:hypothetical protein